MGYATTIKHIKSSIRSRWLGLPFLIGESFTIFPCQKGWLHPHCSYSQIPIKIPWHSRYITFIYYHDTIVFVLKSSLLPIVFGVKSVKTPSNPMVFHVCFHILCGLNPKSPRNKHRNPSGQTPPKALGAEHRQAGQIFWAFPYGTNGKLYIYIIRYILMLVYIY